MLAVQLCCARHCELPLSKIGNKGLFPGVAVPLAFFCTLFFRHRKKSVSAPWDGQSQSAPESARQSPPRGFAYGKVVSYCCKQGAFLGANNRRGPHCRACLNPAPNPCITRPYIHIKNMRNPHPFVSLPRFSFCAFIPAKAGPVTAHSTESLPAKPCNGSA